VLLNWHIEVLFGLVNGLMQLMCVLVNGHVDVLCVFENGHKEYCSYCSIVLYLFIFPWILIGFQNP